MYIRSTKTSCCLNAYCIRLRDSKENIPTYTSTLSNSNEISKSQLITEKKKAVKSLWSVAPALLTKKHIRKMTISFFLTVLALSTPFPISYGATDEFHPPKSPFFAKLNPYLLFEDRMNLTEAQYKFGKYFRFEDPFDGPYNYGKGFWRGN